MKNSAFIPAYLAAFVTVSIAVLWSESIQAYPIVGAENDFEFFSSSADNSVALLPDAADPNLYYVTPKRVTVARTIDGKPLFRLSVSGNDGAEFVGVFVLQYDEEIAETALARIHRTNSQVTVKPLPFLRGMLVLELQSTSGRISLAEAEVVSTAFPHGEIPFSIRIPQASMQLIRMHLNSPAQSFLTLRFMHKTNVQFGSLPYVFRFTPRDLFSRYAQDMEERWSPDGTISPSAFDNYWISRYEQSWDIASRPDDFNVRSASAVFIGLLDAFLAEKFGENFVLRQRSAVRTISPEALPSEPILLDAAMPGRIGPLWGSAGVLLSGLCAMHPDLVYVEDSGASACGEFPLDTGAGTSGGSTDVGGEWDPFS